MPFLKILIMLEKIVLIPVFLPWLFGYGFLAILTRSFLSRGDLKTPRILWGVEAFWRHAKDAYSNFGPLWPSDDDIREHKIEWRHGNDRAAGTFMRVMFNFVGLFLWGMLFGVWDA